jgi:hypothetical protein
MELDEVRRKGLGLISVSYDQRPIAGFCEHGTEMDNSYGYSVSR